MFLCPSDSEHKTASLQLSLLHPTVCHGSWTENEGNKSSFLPHFPCGKNWKDIWYLGLTAIFVSILNSSSILAYSGQIFIIKNIFHRIVQILCRNKMSQSRGTHIFFVYKRTFFLSIKIIHALCKDTEKIQKSYQEENEEYL